MTNQTSKNRPSHSVFMVEGDGEKANWTELGAMWPHEDGDGFALTLKAMPLDGRLVVRKRKAKASKAGAGQ